MKQKKYFLMLWSMKVSCNLFVIKILPSFCQLFVLKLKESANFLWAFVIAT